MLSYLHMRLLAERAKADGYHIAGYISHGRDREVLIIEVDGRELQITSEADYDRLVAHPKQLRLEAV